MKNYRIIFLTLLITLVHLTDTFAGRRTYVYNLTPNERSQLVTQMMAYLNSQQNSNTSVLTDRYLIIKQHKDNDPYIHHYNHTFLGWHRSFLGRMEAYVMPRLSNSLRNKLNGLLPYWDPTTTIPSQFYNGSSVLDGFEDLQDQSPYNNGSSYNVNKFTSSNFCNNYSNGSSSTYCGLARSRAIDKFAADLECEHNDVHNAIGGAMRNPTTSPAAAIFWIWHAWVDEIYWDYEICKGLYASLPYSTSFSGNSTDQYWYTGGSDSVQRVQVTGSNGPHSGSRHLTMDVKINRRYSTNEAILNLNLSNQSNVILTFWWKEFGDEDNDEDGVYISDGGPYVKVMELKNAPYNTWEQRVLNITRLAADNGLNTNSTFKVKFQQRDNYRITTDGFAFDDISVTSGSSSCDNFDSKLSGWSNSSSDDINWTRRRDATISGNTGPDNASNGRYYLYVEASYGNSPSKVATITKSSSPSNSTISFDYNMYGANMGSLVLSARYPFDNRTYQLWSKSGDQGNVWRRVTINIPYSYRQGGYVLVFTATTGSNYLSDIAIDNICIGSSSGRSNQPLVHDQVIQEERVLGMRAYPNPFTESTTIEYTLSEDTEVVLTIRDATGREIKKLVHGTTQEAGTYNVVLQADDLPNGLYFYTLEAQGTQQTGKLMLHR